MKKIILIFYGYCEDEVFLYNSLDELLKHWEYYNLKSFIKMHKNCSIYELGRAIYEAK